MVNPPSPKPALHPSNELLRDILNCWGLTFEAIHPRISIQGSPERCLYRVVVDAGGSRHFLEELDSRTLPRKRLIAARIAHLEAKALPVAAPQTGLDGSFTQRVGSRNWQLTPFLEGIELNPEGSWRDAWRGKALALFLRDLRQASQNMAVHEDVFDLHGYVRKIVNDARRLHPNVCAELTPVFSLIERKLESCASLPVAFCHGDPHPLNMIWGTDRILGAIDWEFCGPKCVLHDMALILGCVGSEDENALSGPFITAFLKTLRGCGLLDSRLETHLPTWTLALRVAWLAEWLRRGDTEMTQFEVFYMRTLENRFFGRDKAF
ncbi:phosphotransferase enzyme family protein [Desulfomicrobium baculatum]|uniref:Aminoglycoside phosphotransferase n=1 Tax=Desulfomicrobium baculatum (strain DSM 4028 / VKM B-1378 / X) TaxID=525897 RepID=C7LQY6_DESBD|nr:phosphotransferase [Desulfomicrobium baculatum]ACU89215.1 aminoglycoside phosphotransferase [Desulfomicrobium baculatum DSM 4028]